MKEYKIIIYLAKMQHSWYLSYILVHIFKKKTNRNQQTFAVVETNRPDHDI